MKATKILPYLFPLLAAVLLAVFESDFLYQLQEQNLFLHTPLFLGQQMVKAGGMLTWIGCYLTQFFFYPILGAGLLCLLWAFFMWLTKRAFHLSDDWSIMTLLPVTCILITITMLGYWVFYLKLPGHAFCATIGVIIAVGATWVYRLVPSRYGLSALYMALFAAVGYVLFGFYGLFAAMLMAVEARHRSRRYALADSIVAMAAIIAVPVVCYYTVYHETNIVNIYWAALPVFGHQGEWFMLWYLPYCFLFTSLVLLAFRPAWPLGRWSRLAIVAVVVASLCLCWNRDDNFHRELSMSRSIEQRNWHEVLATAKGAKDEPTRAMCMMQNLALFRLGRQGEEMFCFPIGARRPNAPFSVRLVHTYGKMLYLQYGLPNYCYRWCMEDGVEYGWTVEKLKLMTLCALVSNEKAAAQKYLSLLGKTSFHKRWVRHIAQLMQHPQHIAAAPELAAILRMMQSDNYLTNDMSQAESFLLEHFSTTQSNNPWIQEQTLLAALQTKNAQLFWPQFFRYTESHRGQRVPRHYQEAACLFAHLDNADTSRMPFDQQVRRDYEELAVTMNRCHQQGIPIAEMRSYISPHLRNTYYYDYYFNIYHFLEE